MGVKVDAFGEEEGEKGKGKEVTTANIPAHIEGLCRRSRQAVDESPEPGHNLGNVHNGETEGPLMTYGEFQSEVDDQSTERGKTKPSHEEE